MFVTTTRDLKYVRDDDAGLKYVRDDDAGLKYVRDDDGGVFGFYGCPFSHQE